MGLPSVSVVLAEHRPREFLIDAATSVLAQMADVPKTEIIVSLAAPDPGFEAWAAHAEPPVHIVRGGVPRLGALLSRGVRSARGEVVCFLDDDDRFRAGKLRHVAELFAADGELEYYHHGISFIDAGGRPLAEERSAIRWLRQPPGLGPIRLAAPEKVARAGELAYLRPDFNASSISLRRAALEPFLDELEELPAGADAFLFHVVGLLGTGALRCDLEPWTEYRIHPHNLSRPEGEGADRSRRLHEVSLAQASGQGYIVDVVRRHGSAAQVRLAEANVATHRFFAALRDPRSTRRGWARALVRLLPYWSTFLVRSNWAALLGSLAMGLWPAAAHQVYLRRSGWRFAPRGPDAAPDPPEDLGPVRPPGGREMTG
jgi:Glycosyl transferase family 2